MNNEYISQGKKILPLERSGEISSVIFHLSDICSGIDAKKSRNSSDVKAVTAPYSAHKSIILSTYGCFAVHYWI